MTGRSRPSFLWLLPHLALAAALGASPGVAAAQIPDCIHYDSAPGRSSSPAVWPW